MCASSREARAIADDVREATDILKGVCERIQNEWTSYLDRPQALRDVETTVVKCLVELERANHIEVPALLKALSPMRQTT